MMYYYTDWTSVVAYILDEMPYICSTCKTEIAQN